MGSQQKHKIICPVFTPYHEDGTLNLSVIKDQALYASKSGVDVAWVNGTTGEGLLLSVNERKLVAEAWKKAAPPELEIIVHVGCEAIVDAKELASHAEKIGVTAIAAVPPTFFRPAQISQLVGCVAEIAAAAPSLPFYYYHFPALSVVTFPLSTILKEAKQVIPTLRGAKYTHIDLEDLNRCCEIDSGRFEMFTGYPSLCLPSLLYGSRGTFVFEFWVPALKKLLQHYQRAEHNNCILLQKRIQHASEILAKHGGLPAAKVLQNELVAKVGIARSPVRKLSSAEKDTFLKEIQPYFDLSRHQVPKL